MNDERDREIEETLTELLAQRLPQHPASLALKRRLAAQWDDRAAAAPSRAPTIDGRAPIDRPRPSRTWWPRPRAWLAAAAVVLIALPVAYDRVVLAPARAIDALVAEAANDHVRLVQSPQPLGVVSGGMHEVKPWFTGKLDFAPVVGFLGDEEFPLRGGTVGYFVDRPAAVFVYARRRHTISLLVFRAERLALPAHPVTRTTRGFTVVVWRAGDLGYALASDVDPADLAALAGKLRG